ncbi:hypothetical protein ALC62_04331 [Cyphomyrmex costatus]|uniref:DNA-directed DNA polymerase n=1 Tax=Cyphomyrmex costatus TaxID=456900 RepID=A0A151IKE3_9HYME|nr:hypothetical protein ALC62_04331 [Cyphomyrmex costatus]
MEDYERAERELLEHCGRVATLGECFAWLERCNECIESLECRAKRPRLTVGHRQSAVARIARLVDASSVVLERVRGAIDIHGSVKVNTAFNGEFVASDKRTVMGINGKNCEIYRCLHYFSSNEKLESHAVDCGKMNECAIRLPGTDDKWLEFRKYCRKQRAPFIVYADLECVLKKTEDASSAESYAYQRHEAFSIAYYVHCSYDSALSEYRCRRDNDCVNSYKFLSADLDKLAAYLDKDKLKIVRSEFSALSDEDFDLLTRKGVFPYEYMDSVERLNDTRLPPRESFHSSLTGDTVSESDYAHAENVWQRFSVRTLGEYSDLYLKTDVLLLADVFENFRDSCVASYGLDPAHYYTLPGFTWDAMLKHTRVKFELLTDIDMVMFVERGIRGGLSQCSGRYARANNRYMRSYDPSEPSSYLMYYDINNLYGWAMCQPLPYADFAWVDNAHSFDYTTVALDSPTRYILEVDLEYPQHLHDAHTDLPFCPTREKPPSKRDDKLLATVSDKQRYVVHYRNLQQCTRHGLRVTKIHRVLARLVSDYNARKHRTIGMRPADETTAVAERLGTVYGAIKIAGPAKFKVGDAVRVSKYKTIFEKGYTPNWTTEVFRIVRVQRTNPVTYLLEDYRGEPVAGGFYEHELLRVADPDVYLVEKVLRKKGDRVYVKWLGFDGSHNSWINKRDVV